MVSRVRGGGGGLKTPSLSNYIYYINPLYKNHPSFWYVQRNICFTNMQFFLTYYVTAMAMKATLSSGHFDRYLGRVLGQSTQL